MTKEFITTRDDIVDTHKDIDQEDLKYFRNIEEMMRENKKDFKNEHNKRYKYVMAMFIKRKIVLTLYNYLKLLFKRKK